MEASGVGGVIVSGLKKTTFTGFKSKVGGLELPHPPPSRVVLLQIPAPASSCFPLDFLAHPRLHPPKRSTSLRSSSSQSFQSQRGSKVFTAAEIVNVFLGGVAREPSPEHRPSTTVLDGFFSGRGAEVVASIFSSTHISC